MRALGSAAYLTRPLWDKPPKPHVVIPFLGFGSAKGECEKHGFRRSTRRPKVRDQRPKTVQVQAGEQGGEAQGGEQGGADRRAARGSTNRWRNHVAPRTPSAPASAHQAVPPYLGAPAPAVYSIYTL